MKNSMIIVILLAFISPSYELSNQQRISKVVRRCQAENEKFTKEEEKYANKRQLGPTEPDLEGPHIQLMQRIVYEKQIHQRPFECITERLNGIPKKDIELNPDYQTLVAKCQSKQRNPQCDHSSNPYRTIDGTCNNLRHPRWGSGFECQKRHLLPYYEGVSGFRRSVCGGPLPNTRYISVNTDFQRNRPTQQVTHMLPLFGQLLTHDMMDTSLTFVDINRLDCCGRPEKDRHPQCAPILLPKDDYFYMRFNVTCLSVPRSAMCGTCSIGKRQIEDESSSFIDASFNYGQISQITETLRAKDGTGKLKIERNEYGDFIPRRENGSIIAGDRHVGQHTSLTSLQTLSFREHNRIAEELRCLNPHWDEETLFQEARKIFIGIFQSIVYTEFLPLLIGPSLMSKYELWIPEQGGTTYNSSVNPTVAVEFSAAAFRLHSLIHSCVSYSGDGKCKRLFRNTFKNPSPVYHNKMDALIKDVTSSPAQKYDRYIAHDLSNFCYKQLKGVYGFDLAAIDIQRGRDDGLPTYTQILNYVSGGQIQVENFEDLSPLINTKNIKALKSIYCDVKDIDALIGMIHECVPHGMLLGPTSAEIVAKQFWDSMKGDRFFFTHRGCFKNEQRETLKKASLSRLICDNTKIKDMQEKAFLFPGAQNPVRRCKDLPSVDLSLWKQ